MHKVFTLFLGALLLAHSPSHAAVLDTLEVASESPAQAPIQWELRGLPGSFEPAGWHGGTYPALTRVQAVRAGLEITNYVDERFDPIRGKNAVLHYFGQEQLEESPMAFAPSHGAILLTELADVAKLTLRALEEQNPHLLRDIAPKGAQVYGIDPEVIEDELALVQQQERYQKALAAQYTERKARILSRMPDPNNFESITYTVRSGDFLGRIASRTGVSVADLQKWNNLQGATIYPGQKLQVWVKKNDATAVENRIAAAERQENETQQRTEQQVAQASEANATPELGTDYITYEVKPGDTLWGIASKFPGVSPNNIKHWNRVEDLIKAGDRLKIRKQTISDYSPDKYPSVL